jgi:hypothetical protein
MTQSNAGIPETGKEASLPWRDWILLPLISLFTIVFLAVSTELIARRLFSELEISRLSCVVNDPSTGERAIPNTACWDKIPESSLVVYRFNGCGHRAGMDCGPKPPATFRIVLIGSSVPMGSYVPFEKSIAGLLPPELSLRAGRRVEVYNESLAGTGGTAHTIDLRINDVLAANPDMVLWILTPGDIEIASRTLRVPQKPADPEAFIDEIVGRAKDTLVSKPIRQALPDLLELARDFVRRPRIYLEGFRTVLMFRHFIYQSHSQSLKSYLANEGKSAGYLKAEWSSDWRSHLREFDVYAADIEARTTAAGVPFAAVLLPYRAQATMISTGDWPADLDPYKLDNELRSIITSHGGIYVDILPDFRPILNPEQYYMPVDGHPTETGHAVIADLLVKELTSGAIPALKAVAEPQSALVRKR